MSEGENESDGATLTCIACRKRLHNILQDHAGQQPLDGLSFFTHGHYGTTYFDPMDGISYLGIVVCDECVKAAEERGEVFRKDAPGS